MRSLTILQAGGGFFVGLVIASLLGFTGKVEASDGRIPFLRLLEEGGHLSLVTCLPAGKMDFSAVDELGFRLSGFVFVEGEGNAKRVRLFRLKGTAIDSDPQEQAIPAGRQIREFSIIQQASTTPDHYVLHVKTTRVENGQVIEDEARLGRNCCGYYVGATRDGKHLPPGRARLLTELMVKAAATYAHFEQLTTLCDRPGFEFVPSSRFSPQVVSQVVATDRSRPAASAALRFRQLVADLDNEQFARREAAASELIHGGRSTCWLLEHAHDLQLSAEQRQRLRTVRAALSEFSQPNLSFEFEPERIRELTESPPADWLSQLRHSSDTEVSNWARHKMSTFSPKNTNGSLDGK